MCLQLLLLLLLELVRQAMWRPLTWLRRKGACSHPRLWLLQCTTAVSAALDRPGLYNTRTPQGRAAPGAGRRSLFCRAVHCSWLTSES